MSSEHADVPRPRTMTVIVLLLIAAVTVSYVGAYGVSGMLVNAEILPAWTDSQDPRPQWMMQSFLMMCGIFAFVAAIARFVSFRQLKHIDRMNTDV